ncbi:nucleotidyltransferase family protein [Micromonospora sp. NPDC023644]|uniref:nucleotidyltransferase family protein n=1 Tax=Micromonospora sp. NPDC023644 TaxID=3154321 RepID=UPI0033D9A9F4
MTSTFSHKERVRYWPLVSELGRWEPDPARLGTLCAERLVSARDADAVAHFVDLSKVVECAVANLAGVPAVGGVPRLRELLAAALARRDEKRAARAEHARHVVRVAADLGGGVIKGLALARYYPDPALRHRGDVDLWFEEATDALALVDRLWAEGDGWHWDTHELPWLKWDGDRAYGQFKLRREVPGARTSVRVDVHFGGYSVGHLGLMPLTGFVTGSVDGVEIRVPTPETDLAILVGHATGDAYTSLKDLNDLAVIAATREVDWPRVYDACRTVAVEPVLDGLITLVRERTGGAGLPEHRRSGRRLPLLDTSGAERARLTALIAYRDTRRRTGAVSGVRAALEALGYYSADLRVRADPSSRPRWRRSRSECWRLVPEQVWTGMLPADGEPPSFRQDDPLLPGIAVYRSGSDWVASCGDEVLVPTVSGRVPAGTLLLADAVRRR